MSHALLHQLNARVEAGHVFAKPDGHGLTLYGYTQPCVYERAWDDITEQARGIVLDDEGNVVSRPFRKFFNLGERPETMIDALPAEVPELADKLDGSLVIVFWHPTRKEFVASTRGGWSNEQTDAAMRWLAMCDPMLSREHTYLFELVAPWNRIVVQYEREEMILIGRIHTATGREDSYAELAESASEVGSWLKVVGFSRRPIASVNMDEEVPNAEGFVARFSNGLRVKMKYAEYRRLHKILTGLSIKGVWELLSENDGKVPIPDVPDEFLAWYDEQCGKFLDAFGDIEREARAIFDACPVGAERKELAAYFSATPKLCGVLFYMLDGKNWSPAIWKMLKPHGVSGTYAFKKDEL